MNNTCFYCKWFKIKIIIMMNGYHGVCNNKNQDKWFHMATDTCEHFERKEKE